MSHVFHIQRLYLTLSGQQPADSDEAGHAFRQEAGHRLPLQDTAAKGGTDERTLLASKIDRLETRVSAMQRWRGKTSAKSIGGKH